MADITRTDMTLDINSKIVDNNVVVPGRTLGKDDRRNREKILDYIDQEVAKVAVDVGEGVYTNLTPTSDTNLHIAAGSTFNNVPFSDMWDMLLYSLNASLSANNTPRRLGSTNAVTLTWSATPKGSEAITSIVVDGVSQTITGGGTVPQSGTKAATSVQNVNTTFTMTVTSADGTITRTATVSWLNDSYIGALNVVGSGATAVLIDDFVASPPTDSQIKTLLTGGLATSRAQSHPGFNAGGNFPAVAWRTAFGTPTFIVNGLTNTAWTKVRSASAFTNASGYTENFDVWIANTRYNSPLGQFQII